jgi:hypothetical protein
VVLLSALALLSWGCDEGSLDPVACTTEYVSGLVLEVREAGTGAPAAQGAVATVTDGDYVEVAAGPVSGDPNAVFIAAAGERPGTYAIQVVREGYITWDTAGVVVEADICHVIPEQVPVGLVPAS